MGELRGYALAVAELPAVVGATGEWRERVRALAQQAFAPGTGGPAVRDLIGPIYRRVPGQRVVRDDDPTPADLDALLVGEPVRPARAAATWRLVEAAVAGLAWASTRVPVTEVDAALLTPTVLPVPPVDDLVVGWCTVERAAAIAGLDGWLDGADDWAAAAARAGRPRPDVIAFWAR